jgi:hypothetical protein
MADDYTGLYCDDMDIRESTRSYERWLGRHVRLVPADLRRKHTRMTESPFVLLRGTFYRWMELWPEACRESADAPTVVAVGDLPVENFGTWRDAEGRLVWGVNDVDEAWRLPYTNDLTRLATSAMLAIGAGRLALTATESCDAILEGYRRGIESGGRPLVLAEHHRWLRELALGELRDPARYWAGVDRLSSRGMVPARARRVLRSALPDPRLPHRVAHRIAGVGSLGRERFVALATWGAARIAREIKAQAPSAASWATGRKESSPAACATILEHAVRAPDPFFSVRNGWIVRRLSPDCSRIDLDQLPRERDERRILRAMGFETANMHLGTPGARIASDLRRRRGRWLVRAARIMARATEADWRAWRG